MKPQHSKKIFGYDVEGNMYERIFNDEREEIKRIPTGERIIWQGATADLGIKELKRTIRKEKGSSVIIRQYKENVWKYKPMQDAIARTALKAIPKPKKKVVEKKAVA